MRFDSPCAQQYISFRFISIAEASLAFLRSFSNFKAALRRCFFMRLFEPFMSSLILTWMQMNYSFQRTHLSEKCSSKRNFNIPIPDYFFLFPEITPSTWFLNRQLFFRPAKIHFHTMLIYPSTVYKDNNIKIMSSHSNDRTTINHAKPVGNHFVEFKTISMTLWLDALNIPSTPILLKGSPIDLYRFKFDVTHTHAITSWRSTTSWKKLFIAIRTALKLDWTFWLLFRLRSLKYWLMTDIARPKLGTFKEF